MRAIKEGLDSLKSNPIDGWTKTVLTKLCEIGQGLGFKVSANGGKLDKAKRDWGAWFYDLTWLKYNDAGRVVAVPFVAECEWGRPEGINDDFDRLLLARARVRLTIYEGSRKCGSNRAKQVTELARRIRELTDSRAEDAWLQAIYEDNRDDLPKGSDKKGIAV